MNISPDEAQEALAAIQQIRTKTLRSLSSRGAAYYMILWGVIWFIGFMISHFWEPVAGTAWMILDILGGVLSWAGGIYFSRRVRSRSGIESRVWLFFLTIFAYGALIAITNWPMEGRQTSILAVLVAMMGTVALGVLFDITSVTYGIVLTILALVGYYVFPGIYFLWMAILGGGSLTGGGVYLWRKWR